MPVEPVELIAIDLDGTLLDGRGRLSAANHAAIDAARRKGVRVVLATMRPPRAVDATFRQLGLDSLQINHNGALIYDQPGARVVGHRPLAAVLAQRVLAATRAVDPTIRVGIEVVDRLYTRGGEPRGEPAPGHGGRRAGDLAAALDQPVTKIFMTGPTSRLADIQAAVRAEAGELVSFAVSHLNLLQVMAGGVDKAQALAQVAGHYGVKRAAVLAIGDAPNDLGMLRWAGLGVAVGDAWSEVRRAAHFVVAASGADGVAQAITRYVL